MMTSKEDTPPSDSIKIGGKYIEFGSPLLDSLHFRDIVVVRLDLYDLASDDPLKGRNVIAFNMSGDEVWRIEPFWWTVKTRDGRKVPDSYTQIRIGEDGKLYAYQPIGFVCEIDPKTGKILDEHQTR